VMLSAGLGKRMDPLTSHHLPKPMFPLGGGVPMSELWVRKFVEAGITDISMNLCVLSETIKNHFGDGVKYGAKISFVEEKEPSGTLGGVCKQALGKTAKRTDENETKLSKGSFKGDTVVVASGDIVTNFSAEHMEAMYDIHRKKGAAITVILTPIPWEERGEFGTVELFKPRSLKSGFTQMGRVRSFREKDAHSPSNLNNGSIYMIEMELIKALDPFRTPASVGQKEPFYDFGKHVFPALLGKLDYVKLPRDYSIWGIEYGGLWFDVGRKSDYLKVNEAFLDGKISLRAPYEELPWGYLGANVTIDFSEVNIIPPVIIGNNCVIQPGVTLGPYAVIGSGWTIEKKALITHSVLWPPYDYYTDAGDRVTLQKRKLVDPHEIRGRTHIDHCIIVGGTIQESLSHKTVDVLLDGQVKVADLNSSSGGARI
jgi:NDP-sugar pyrophosphorylase family protein